MDKFDKDTIINLMNLETEPVTAILPDGRRLFMERIKKTCKYLSHNKKVIKDTSFYKLYAYDKKIPEDCIVVGGLILHVDRTAHFINIDEYLDILNSEIPHRYGTKIYMDDVLFIQDIPVKEAENIRNKLLRERVDGKRWFNKLTIIDPSGNKTTFLPSKRVYERNLNRLKDERDKEKIRTT